MMTFSDKLKALRKEKGISQEDLAEVLHVTRQSVSKWETGVGYPDIEKIKMLSDYYRVSLDELLDHDSTNKKEMIEEEEEEEDEDFEVNLMLGGFIVGTGLGLVTGNFLLGTAGAFIGMGIPYILKSFKRINK